MRKRWQGLTAACIASGPSLTASDCALIASAGLPTIAVNSSWRLARFAAVIYAGDPAWWQAYGAEIDIAAARWTCTEQAAARFDLNLHRVRGGYNSGLRAIQLAIEFGAARVLLLGYDCSVAAGTHWHGNHDKTKNPDVSRCQAWQRQFAMLDRKGVEIINCSRETALTCFPCQSLEAALCE
nr:hypothetical protein [uncultured Pseudomonas sp.]